MKYFANLTKGRIILWCYFIWYAFFVTRYFDASRNLWLTSLGIAVIVGFALLLNAATNGSSRIGFWPAARFFMMPFCVSSFAALVKGHGFFLIFSPRMQENYFALGIILAFCGLVL